LQVRFLLGTPSLFVLLLMQRATAEGDDNIGLLLLAVDQKDHGVHHNVYHDVISTLL
jgi:hypothetical protein